MYNHNKVKHYKTVYILWNILYLYLEPFLLRWFIHGMSKQRH